MLALKSSDILSIGDIEKKSSGPEIWAINSTNENARTRIIIACAKMYGDGNDTVELYNTFIPINLTGQINKKQLLQSSDFRKAVSRGFITLVTADYAKRVLNTQAGRLEYRRIMDELGSRKRNVQEEALRRAEEINAQLPGAKNQQSPVVNRDSTHANDVKPAVVQIMANSEGQTDLQVFNSLINTGSMTSLDWEYVHREAKSQGLNKLAEKAANKFRKRPAKNYPELEEEDDGEEEGDLDEEYEEEEEYEDDYEEGEEEGEEDDR